MRLLGLIFIAVTLLVSACTTEPLFPPEANGPTGSPSEATPDVSLPPATGNVVDEQPSTDETSDEDTQDAMDDSKDMDDSHATSEDTDAHDDSHDMDDAKDMDSMDDSKDMDDAHATKDMDDMQKASDDYATTVTVTEGDLISLSTEAVDPDGDPVDVTFSSPISRDGTWQTRLGDAGEYDVTVTASDGKSETDMLILVQVLAANGAPAITGPDAIRVLEGEEVDLGVLTIVDPDGDEFVTSYAGWMLSSTYRTTFEDAGTHSVRVIAQDTEGNEATKQVTVVVENVNRGPKLSFADRTIEAVEGDLVVIEATMEDPDDDPVTISFEAPFDDDGTWQTSEGDAGEYRIDVTATDGDEEISRVVRVDVAPANRPPVITVQPRVTVMEGDLIDLEELVSVNDPEGDDVVVSYEGWLTESTYQTTFDDAGEYLVTVVASDGERESRQGFALVVEDKNRPPVFILG